MHSPFYAQRISLLNNHLSFLAPLVKRELGTPKNISEIPKTQKIIQKCLSTEEKVSLLVIH